MWPVSFPLSFSCQGPWEQVPSQFSNEKGWGPSHGHRRLGPEEAQGHFGHPQPASPDFSGTFTCSLWPRQGLRGSAWTPRGFLGRGLALSPVTPVLSLLQGSGED